MHGVAVTVVSFVAHGAGGIGHRLGHAAAPSPRPRSPRWSRPPTRAARAGYAGRGRPADLVRDRTSADWDDAPVADRHPRLRRVRPRARRGLRPGRRRGPGALRLRQPRGHHHLPRLDHRAAAAPRPADRPLRLHRQDRRPHARAPGSAAPPATSPTSTRWPSTPSSPRRLGWGERRVDLPGRPLRHDPAADRGGRPDDRRLLVRRRPGRLGGPVGLQPARRRHPDRRAHRRAPGSRCPPTRRTPGWSARRSRSRRPRATTSSVFDNGLPLGRTDWIRDGELTALLQTRHTAAMTDQPVTPAIDNLVLERRRRHRHHRGPRRRHRARAAADLPVVHPRGRPADPAADRPDPRRGLPRRERRDHRRGQQLPVQREPGRPAPPLQPRLRDRAELQPRVGRRLLLPHRHARPAGPRLQRCRASRRPR